MIKKVFSVLLFVGVFCVTSCFGYTEISNCYTGYSNTCNTKDKSRACWEIESGETFVYGNMTYTVDNNFNISTYYSGNTYNTLELAWVPSYYYDRFFTYTFWGEDNYLHKVLSTPGLGYELILDDKGLCVVNSSDIHEIANYCGYKSYVNWACGSDSCETHYNSGMDLFYATNGNFDKIYFLPVSSNVEGTWCFVKGDTGYCLYNTYNYEGRIKNCSIGTYTGNLTSLQSSNLDLSDFSSNFYSSPFNGSSSDEEKNNKLTDYTIKYFESMGFRPELCYVGTNDLTTNYGGSGSFELGTGKTIFDLFESEIIYIEDTQLGYQAVSNWLNTWLINYDEWFSTNGQPGYLAEFYEFGEKIHLTYYYSGDTPVFPFLNKPFAVYFMASNISSFVQKKSIYDYEGDYVVDYCNMKLNGATSDQMISKGLQSSIEDQYSNNIGGDNFGSGGWSGGTGSFGTGSSGTGSSGTGSSGTGSGSGDDDSQVTREDLQFTGKVDLKSFFDNALDEMKSAIDNNNKNPFTGVLPNYIIFGLLLVVLFKILRH